jgi:hypothetical protein
MRVRPKPRPSLFDVKEHPCPNPHYQSRIPFHLTPARRPSRTPATV